MNISFNRTITKTAVSIITGSSKGENIFRIYAAALYAYLAYCLLQWPITALDTDLWYHLNSGRYIFENWSIPKDSYFSFIQPPREWVDYYWLFQALVFKIHSLFDYYGLVFLRAFIFFALITFIIKFLLKGYDGARHYWLIAIVFSFFLLLFLPRYHLIRPHMLSYLFVAAFLYILEFKPKKRILLPFLAVLWTNIHGVMYPIMILILLSYLAEIFFNHIRRKVHITPKDFTAIVPLIVSICAVYLTPHGWDLTWMPFVPTGFSSLYIIELGHLTLRDLFSFNFNNFVPNHPTVFNILLIFVAIAAVAAIRGGTIRLSQSLLLLGGIVLLTKGNRFRYEFVLLSLPVLQSGLKAIPVYADKKAYKVYKEISTFLAVLVLIIPLAGLCDIFRNLPRYPVSYRNLPKGVATFLNKVNVQGTLLNHPNNGGFLQWMLYPRYKIFMDMEVPFLFTNDDMFIAVNIFRNESFLQKTIDRYNPAFITVSIKDQLFKEIIKKFPQYRAVFFDDYEVLYANRELNPSIVSAYELKSLDPFRLAQSAIQSVSSINADPIREELLKVIAVYPDNGIANQYLAILYNLEGRYEKAIEHADNIIANYPESPTGYILKGDSLQNIKMYDKAIDSYKQAIKRQDAAEIHRKIGMVYFKKNMFHEAYKTLVGASDPYSPFTTYRDLYYLIYSAIKINKKREAEILFGYANQSVPATDQEWLKRYQELGAVLGQKIPQ